MSGFYTNGRTNFPPAFANEHKDDLTTPHPCDYCAQRSSKNAFLVVIDQPATLHGSSAPHVYDENFNEGKIFVWWRAEGLWKTGIAWELNSTATVKFVDWNGTVLKTQTVSRGGTVTPPADPTRAHYTFVGWNRTDFTGVNFDMIVKAMYEEISPHIVNFYDCDDSDDGRTRTLIASISVSDGAVPVLTSSPTFGDFVVDEWLPDDGSPDFGQPITADASYGAHWKMNINIAQMMLGTDTAATVTNTTTLVQNAPAGWTMTANCTGSFVHNAANASHSSKLDVWCGPSIAAAYRNNGKTVNISNFDTINTNSSQDEYTLDLGANVEETVPENASKIFVRIVKLNSNCPAKWTYKNLVVTVYLY